MRARRHGPPGQVNVPRNVSACRRSPSGPEGLARALDLGVDLVAQSFVRGPQDIKELRALMGTRVVPIVAKIETKPAVEQIDTILRVTDVVMVARGDLGVELPMEEIPLLQKDLLRAARAASTPAIVATQMLESMIRAPRPTRAEATDVANAVLDGADGIMLSGETAIGRFPFEAAAAAASIAAAVESRGAEYRAAQPACRHAGEGPAVAHAAAAVAIEDRNVVAITCYTETGRTARLLSAERPSCPVYAFIPGEDVRRANAVLWGVTPLLRPEAGRHRRDDRADGRGTPGVRARGTGRRGRHGGGVTRRQDHHEHAEDPSCRISRPLVCNGLADA
jgi:pyruvate kinase